MFLGILYKNNLITSDELLELNDFVSVPQRHLQSLAIELYKIFSYILPGTLACISLLKISFHYDIKNPQIFYTRSVKST